MNNPIKFLAIVLLFSIMVSGMMTGNVKLGKDETESIYYPYSVVYEKGDNLNISTFTTVKPVSITMGSGVIKVDGVELDKSKGATKILNVEAITPIISKE